MHYEGMRRVSYKFTNWGEALFLRVCPKCGRFVRAAERCGGGYEGGWKFVPVATATCSKCGEVKLRFEGWY